MPYFSASRRSWLSNGARSCIIEITVCQPPGARTISSFGFLVISATSFGSMRLTVSTCPVTRAFSRALLSLMTVMSNESTCPRSAFQ